MTTLNFIKLYLVTIPVFLILDLIWLGLISKDFYQKHIGFLLKTNVNWAAAIAFYILFIAGIIIFATAPAIEKNSIQQALIYGCLFGLISYATYDLTNLATLKGWPLTVTIVDLIWGAVISGSVSTAGFYLYKLFIK
jgi:uncharacterized membrane protein